MSRNSKLLCDVWTEIRQPFALCPCMRRLHKCKFEMIDAHLAGCLLCGRIHDCTKGCCAEEGVIETGDSIVCSVTGLCIRETIFLDSEFVDTVASYGRAPVPESRMQISLSTVTDCVQTLLASKLTQQAHALEQKRWRNKVQSQATALVNKLKNKGQVNLLSVVQEVLARNHAPCVLQDQEMCERLVEQVSENICRILNTCMNVLKMHVRPSEVRVLVFGLCYLMRSGVNIAGVAVIPRHEELDEVLPPENALSGIFQFRAKFITDIENKMKFLFRSTSNKLLREMFQ